jgi:hypothetical protein
LSIADLVADGSGRSEALNFLTIGWTPFVAAPDPPGRAAEDSATAAMTAIATLVLSSGSAFFLKLPVAEWETKFHGDSSHEPILGVRKHLQIRVRCVVCPAPEVEMRKYLREVSLARTAQSATPFQNRVCTRFKWTRDRQGSNPLAGFTSQAQVIRARTGKSAKRLRAASFHSKATHYSLSVA